MHSHNDVPVNTPDKINELAVPAASNENLLIKSSQKQQQASSQADSDTIVIDLTPDHDTPTVSQVIKIEIVDGPVNPRKAARLGCFQISKAALIPALLAAGIEVADVMTSLIGAKRSFVIVVPASVTAYLASFGLTGHPTEQAFGEICGIIRNRGLPKDKPEDWPQLSYYQELVAIILTTTLASWGTFSKFTWAYYIMNTVPGDYSLADTVYWKLASLICAAGFTLTGLMTESYDAYKLIRKWLVHEKVTYPHRLGKYFSLGIGVPFGVINAAMDSTQAITTISDTYKIKGAPGFWMIATPAILFDGGQKLAFEGRTVINSIYDLVAYLEDVLQGKGKIDPNAAVAFSISLAMSIFLEFSKQSINYGFYKNEAGDFNLDGNNHAIATFLLALSWLSFGGGILIGTPSLFPEMKTAVEWSGRKICAAKKKISGYCPSFWKSREEPLIEEPLLISAENADLETGFTAGGHGPKIPSYNTFK